MSWPPPDRVPEQNPTRSRRRGADAAVGILVVVGATAGLSAVALLVAFLALLAFPGVG